MDRVCRINYSAISCMRLPFLVLLSCADVPTSKSHSLFVLDVVWDWQDYFSPCLCNVKWQHIEDCFGFKISVGVPTGADAAHESVVIQTSFPLISPSEIIKST
ncbi:hypothetical protein Pelo_17216 [Pelomyxa schiedti]|nr:hypothetical protein Pelo_17216 [Pelomyxa schiedti]